MIKISIVEDDKEIRESLAILIEGTDGFSCVSHYGSVELALDKIETDAPDVILMDINLPGMTGIEGVKLIKQKMPEINGGYKAVAGKLGSYGKTHDKVYSELSNDHPIDLTRYQVISNYMGRAGLINSGGASGKNDFGDAAMTAVVNKRAGGMGLISGRKAFQRPMEEGVKLLNLIQDVYLCDDVSVA